ncbi:MAG: 6-phosphogluconolactonase [Rhizomicrobium sp.]
MTEATSRGAVNFEAFADAETLDTAAAALIAASLRHGLDARGVASLIVTGGRTPSGIYDRLARTPLAWEHVEITLSDERCIDSRSPESNERLVRDHLLQRNAACAHFIPLLSFESKPEECISNVERRLAAMHWPMDLVLLGMGEDGHIASLFPDSPVLSAALDTRSHRRCIGVPDGKPAPIQLRLSLTLRALLDTRAILIVATGNAKRHIFEEALTMDRFDVVPIAALLHHSRAPIRFLWAP